MTLTEANALDAEAFLSVFGNTFEHSPWIMTQVADERPFSSIQDILTASKKILDDASEQQKLNLLRAHPELAGKAAIDKTLTRASETEQASAGLDRMNADEFAVFHKNNTAYNSKFGFPFIICVRLSTKALIMEAMQSRLDNSKETEFGTALNEVMKIASLRLSNILESHPKKQAS